MCVYTHTFIHTHTCHIYSLAIVHMYAMYLEHIHPQLLPFTSLDVPQHLSLPYLGPPLFF